jgi:membrane protease YdiL (CAAX protease family)
MDKALASTRYHPLTDPFQPNVSPWQKRPLTQVVAALAAICPMLIITVWMYLIRESPITLNVLLLGPLLGGGSLIVWLLALQLLVCGDRLDSLGLRRGKLWHELAIGSLLAIAFLALHFFFQNTLTKLFPPRPPAEEIIELISGVSRNPWLLALWLGPVVWIGVALFEELLKAFVLRRLWQLWQGPAGRWVVLALVSVLFGLAHGYQGLAAIVSISIQSFLMGWFFMFTGRLRVLIVAHALYDSIQIVFAVVAVRSMTG